MTIAGCFNINRWFIFFSDTEYNHDGKKYSGPKIFTKLDYPDRAVATCFAFAGHATPAKKTIIHIEKVIAKLSQAELNHARVYDVAETILEDAVLSLQGTGEFFYLLFGVWIEGEGAKLYGTCQDLIEEIKEYGFVGYGDQFARYITVPLYRPSMEALDALTLANHVLAVAKDNAEGCGKKSVIGMMSQESAMAFGIEPQRIADMGDLQVAFHEKLHQILFAASTPTMDRSKVEEKINDLKKTLEEIKAVQENYAIRWERVQKALSGPNPTQKDMEEAIMLSIFQTSEDSQ